MGAYALHARTVAELEGSRREQSSSDRLLSVIQRIEPRHYTKILLHRAYSDLRGLDFRIPVFHDVLRLAYSRHEVFGIVSLVESVDSVKGASRILLHNISRIYIYARVT